MNLFACDNDPGISARSLPDKHVCKMCIENAQMLAVAVGDLHGFGWGQLRKKDDSFYSQKAHVNHPSTKWVRASYANLAWTICHGFALCHEYTVRYGKIHASQKAHFDAAVLFAANVGALSCWRDHDDFARAMPEYIKHDDTITSVEAYRKYLTLEKPWAVWKLESRKPDWWNPSLYQECQSPSTANPIKSTENSNIPNSMSASSLP